MSFVLRPGRDGLGAKKWPVFLRAYALFHAIWILLYGLLGKGFAYAGVAPVYAGELLLLFSVLALIVSRRTINLFVSPLGLVSICFVGWQLICTVPQIETYGFDALRDGVIWGYSLFAWVAAALVLRLPGLLKVVINRYAVFSKLYVALAPIALILSLFARDAMPHWPGTNVSVPWLKGGEFCVHLAGIFAFTYLGLGGARWMLGLVLLEALLGMNVRGGLLALFSSVVFVVCLRPHLQRYAAIALIGCVLLVLGLGSADIRVEVPGNGREYSLDRLTNSFTSVVIDSDRSALENTKRWRIMWWTKIWSYTVEGPYFWMGKGYGINLADSDGFQAGTPEEPLRSPHSSHLTFLARSGVPGVVLWIALQLTWAASMFVSYSYARQMGALEWVNFFAWILAYWIAFNVCAAFDVFFEGPMAGIPFWTLFGLGWGGHLLFGSQLQPKRRRSSKNGFAYA